MADKEQSSNERGTASAGTTLRRTSRGIVVLLGAFAVFLVPPIYLGWTYVDHQIAYQTDRDVRALEAAGSHFQETVAAYAKIVKTYASRDALGDFEKQVPQASADPYTKEFGNVCFPTDTDETESVEKLFGNPAILTYAPHDPDGVYIGYRPDNPPEGKSVPPPLCIRVPFTVLLENAKEERFFDGMFVADATGAIVYQGKSSVHLDHLDVEPAKKPSATVKSEATKEKTEKKEAEKKEAGKEKTEKNESPKSVLAATDQTEFSRSGVQYKLFTRPIRLPLPLRGFGEPVPQRDVQWVVGGFVQQSRFDRETRALPASLVSAVPFLLLLVALAWPALKLWSLDAHERIRWFDVHLLALCSVLGVALITLGAAHLYARNQMRERVDADLDVLSRRITAHFASDLRDAAANLDLFIKKQGVWMTDEVRELRTPENEDKTDVLGNAEFADEFRARPYFDMLLWADAKGEQRVKWSTLDSNTPRINTGAIDVFKQTKSGTLDALDIAQCSAHVSRFAFQVFPSPITGKTVAALARPRSYEVPRLTRDGSSQFIYTAIVPHLRSVIEPVLPLDYGFAIIQSDGRVLLHSDSSRNAQENFFAESASPLLAQSSVQLAHADRFDVDYHGVRHRMLVSPLPNLKLSLVVFHDESMLRTLQAEMLMSSSVMLITCILLYLASVMIVFAVWPEDAGEWIWPDRRRVAVYYRCIAVCAVLSVCVVCCLFAARGLAIVAISMLAAGMGELFVFFQLGRDSGPRTRAAVALGAMALAAISCALVVGPGFARLLLAGVVAMAIAGFRSPRMAAQASQRRLIRGYCWLWVAVVVLVAVMPSLAIYKDAYGHATETLVRAGELALADAVARRGEDVNTRYAPIKYEGDDFVQNTLADLRDVYLAPHLLGQRSFYSIERYCPGDDAETSFSTRSANGGWLLRDTCFDRPDDEECQLFMRHPAGLVSTLFPFYDPVAARLRRLPYEHAADLRWWTVRGETPSRKLEAIARNVRYGYYTSTGRNGADEGPACLTAIAKLPPLSPPSAPLAWLVLASITGLGFLLAMRLVRWVGNALFGLEGWYDDASAQSDVAAGSPATTDPTQGWMKRTWRRFQPDPREALERLLRDECGTKEPGLLRIAERIRARKDAETMSREQVLELIGDDARSDYERRWQSFTPQRRLALVQLAQDGFVNPRNWDEMRAAHREGIVRRTPAVRFVSEAFRRFVATVESPAQIATWEKPDVERGWADTRTIASAVIVVAAVAMVLTRPDVFNTWVGIATGVVGGVPVLMRLFGMATSRGDAKKEN